jgi:hypothetical protein
MEMRPMDFGETREVARLRVRMLEELGELGGEEPRALIGPTEAFLARRLGSGGHFTSVAEEAGRLVGIASLEVFERLPYPGSLSGREGYVLNVYVEPASRRRGSRARSSATWWAWPAAKAWAGCGCTPARAGGVRGGGLRGAHAGGDAAPGGPGDGVGVVMGRTGSAFYARSLRARRTLQTASVPGQGAFAAPSRHHTSRGPQHKLGALRHRPWEARQSVTAGSAMVPPPTRELCTYPRAGQTLGVRDIVEFDVLPAAHHVLARSGEVGHVQDLAAFETSR